MQRPAHLYLFHGVVGGIVAGAVVALWFLARDLATTGIFHTPGLLASAILQEEFVEPTVRLVATYTLLHFGVFAVLGLAAVAVLKALNIPPGLLIGVVYGVGVLNTVHYGALLVTDAEFFNLLPVFHVIGANLLGGMAVMAYLHWAVRSEAPIGWKALEAHPMLLQGIGTGLLGAGAVALWFFVVDIVATTPFFTPAALGSALLLGASSPVDVDVTAGIVAAYSFIHLAAFGVVGVAFAWVAERIERTPSLWLLALMAFIVLEGLFLATTGTVAEWVLGTIGWWAVGVGNLVAVATMGWWIWVNHPGLKERLVDQAVATRV